MRRSPLALISSLACLAQPVLALVAVVASATTLQKLELDDLIRQSTAIVRARVTGTSAMARGGDVYTLYQLDVAEHLKIGVKTGVGSAPGIAELAVPGGVAGGLRQMVPGAPVLQRDREYLLFLWTGRSGITQLMGLSQGLFTVAQTAGGEVKVAQTKATERMLDGSGRRVQPGAIMLTLAELRLRVSMVGAKSPGAKSPGSQADESGTPKKVAGK